MAKSPNFSFLGRYDPLLLELAEQHEIVRRLTAAVAELVCLDQSLLPSPLSGAP